MRFPVQRINEIGLTAKIGLKPKITETTNNETVYYLLLPFGIYCMLLPFEELLSFGDGEGGMTISRLVGILVICLFTNYFLFSKRSLKPRNAQVWLVLFVGFACFSLAWSIAPKSTIERFPQILNLLLLYLVVGSFRTSRKGLDLLILMIVTSGVAAALYTIYCYHVLYLRFYDTARASIVHNEKSLDPNMLVFTLLLPLSLLLWQITQASGWWRRLGYWVALLSMGYAITITSSRSGFLAMAVIILLYFFHKGSKRTRLPTVTLIIVAILAMLSSDVFSRRIAPDEVNFEHLRGETWLLALSALPDYWLLGGGYESFGKIFMDTSHQPHEYGAHSIYLSTLLELGVVGLFILTVALVQHYKALRINSQMQINTTFALKAAFIGMLVQGAFLDTLSKKCFWLVLGMIMMLSAGATGVSRQRR